MGIAYKSSNSRQVNVARPVLDLYVGSLADFALDCCDSRLSWHNVRHVSQEELRKAAEPSFVLADSMERGALERILSSFLTHRESRTEHSWLLRESDVPIGVCLISERYYYSPERRTPYVDLVAVAPTHRQQGLASQLLCKSAWSLWSAGHRSVIHAHVRRGNTSSEQLFRKHGFLLWHADCEQPSPGRSR